MRPAPQMPQDMAGADSDGTRFFRCCSPLMQRIPYAAVMESPLPGGWRLGVKCSPEALLSVDFLPSAIGLLEPVEPIAVRTVNALRGYFRSPLEQLPDVPLAPAGTAYERRVWEALMAIPVGQTVTYGELAERLQSRARAVAAACRANPIPLFIPCHRVVAKNDIGGYMGATPEGIAIKRWLLAHESPG